jgi:hypothetical protein
MSKRIKRTRLSRALAIPAMPDQTVRFLTLSAGLIFAFYIMLVITTVAFATMQTSLAVQVRETEGHIAALESTYYAAIAVQNATTPGSAGMVAPAAVTYAVEKPANSISLAGH